MPVENKAFGEMFAEAKDGLDHLQAQMASVLPSFPGMPVAKYFDLAIGVDFHPTTFPPLPLCPVPHIGMVFDIMGAIMSVVAELLPPMPEPPEVPEGEEPPPPPPISVLSVATAVVGAMKPSVKVNGMWIANAGTGIQHLPGIVLHVIPTVAGPMASSEMWMGSSTVLADGGPFSTQFHPALSCNLVGIPSLFRMNKPPKPKISLMAPTSLLLTVIPGGPPVLVGGPPTIDLFQLLFKAALKGLGKLWKKAGKAFQNAIDKIKTKNPKLGKILQSFKCKMFGEPVDAATGRVYHSNVDFELPGPVPLVWERTYYSDAEIEGPLGYNWHHSYNMGLYDLGDGFFTLRLRDGRETVLPALALGEEYFSRGEQLLWQKTKEGYVLKDAGKLQYRFEGPQNMEGFRMLSSIKNSSGLGIQFMYDPKGMLMKIIDSSNRQLSVASDTLGRILGIYTEVDSEIIHFIQYAYDAKGNMVQTTDTTHASKHFVYDGHLLVKLTNQSGNSFYWEYEGRGDDARCIHTWGDGGVLEYWSQFEEGKTTVRNSLGHITEYYYNPQTKLIHRIVDANGGVTHQTYNEFSELSVVIDPEGLTTKYRYNLLGQLVKYTNENEESTTFTYDEDLNLVEVTSPGDASISWAYDELGRMVRKKDADGNIMEFLYDGAHLSSIVDRKQRSYHLEYDIQHNLTKILYPQGISQSWKYDALGRTIQSTDVRGNTNLFGYDTASNLISIEEPDGNKHKFSYDTSGNLIHAKDTAHEVKFTYGTMGTLLSRQQNGTTIHFNYDTELQLRGIVNEGSEVYKFGLDALGNVVSEWGFDGLHRRYLRDGLGRVLKVLRPNELWTSYEYDGIGNIVAEEHSDGSRTAYSYTKDGLLKEAFNEEEHIKFQRNRSGRVIKELQGKHVVNSCYDPEGLRTETTSSLGAEILHTYDELGILGQIKAQTGGSQAWEATLKHDKTGLELHRQLSGGISVHTDRDRLGRVTRRSIGAHNIEQSRTRYDWGQGHKLNRIINELSRAETSFEYDAFDNLISATYQQSSGTETVYRIPDAIGNLFKTQKRNDRVYGKGGKLLKDERYHYHYDAEGNLIFKEFKTNENVTAISHKAFAKNQKIELQGSGTGWLYDWAANGLLRQVTTPTGSAVKFFYDPLGRRIAKQHKDRVTRWVWDGNTPLHEWQYSGEYPPKIVLTEDGTPTTREEPVEQLITWIFETGSFIPCAKITPDEQYSIIADYLGTPTHGYDSQGKQVWERDLDCYGQTRRLVGNKNFCPYLYQGQYVDQETGLAYNRFRYYDPEAGSYISQDPIGLNGNNPTLYAYVNDTNIWLDIFGLHAIFDQQLADIAKQAHDVLRDADGNPTRNFNNSTVSVAEIEINGEKQLIASGNGAKLTPAQRAKLEELGVPRQNILSGKKYKTILADAKQTNLANHAERVIITNLPKGAKFTGRWGVSWAGRQRNASCLNCQPHVDNASKTHH